MFEMPHKTKFDKLHHYDLVITTTASPILTTAEDTTVAEATTTTGMYLTLVSAMK